MDSGRLHRVAEHGKARMLHQAATVAVHCVAPVSSSGVVVGALPVVVTSNVAAVGVELVADRPFVAHVVAVVFARCVVVALGLVALAGVASEVVG